jgi:hypothetical protein
MQRVFRSGLAALTIVFLIGPLLMVEVFAQNTNINNFLNLGNFPVNYDPPYVIGRGTKSADSIDACLKRKEFFYNELYNIWVEGLVRCEKNTKGVLSKSTFQGISTTPEDEQDCKGLREDQILVNGTPSENQARYWSEHCATNLGAVGGATAYRNQPVTSGTSTSGSRPTGSGGITLGQGTPTVPTNLRQLTGIELTALDAYRANGFRDPSRPDSYFRSLFESMNLSQRSALKPEQLNSYQQHFFGTGGTAGRSGFNPVYTGPGVVVPGQELIATGISKETSLINLIIFYTNVTLPYVSVLSIFAFVTAGLYYILTFANEELNGKAKTIMLYVVIGIVIIFSSYTVVNFLLGLSATAG